MWLPPGRQAPSLAQRQQMSQTVGPEMQPDWQTMSMGMQFAPTEDPTQGGVAPFAQAGTQIPSMPGRPVVGAMGSPYQATQPGMGNLSQSDPMGPDFMAPYRQQAQQTPQGQMQLAQEMEFRKKLAALRGQSGQQEMIAMQNDAQPLMGGAPREPPNRQAIIQALMAMQGTK